MNKLKIIIAGFAFLLMSASAFANKHLQATLGDDVPGLVIKNDTTVLSLESLKGKWVILSFWSAGDAESRMYQNQVASMSQTYGFHNTSKPIEIISVNLDKSKLLMKEIIEIDNLHSDMQFHVENPSEINSIKSKICMSIVEKQKKAEADAKIAEQNSKKETVETEDIFSEMCTEVTTSDEEDLNIF